jgi:ethanolamine utilization protein EutN
MDIARIIGTIVSTQKVATLEGVTICVIQPLNEKLEEAGQPLVATDATCKRGVGEVIYYVASGDAVFTGLEGEDIPVDAAIMGIVDSIHVAKD